MSKLHKADKSKFCNGVKTRLMTPGPTPVPENIMNEMAKPIIHHRTAEYRAIFKEVNEGLKEILRTKNDIAIFTSSGTGAMEAACVNLLSAGDKTIVVRGGKFGERFTEICEAYGVKAINVDIEWGSAPDPSSIKKILDSDPSIKAVFTTLCETSTATVYDIKAIGNIVKEYDAVLVVDVISGLGADVFDQDAWHVDVAVGGSQKGLMIPPGLSFISISKKAWKKIEESKLPKYYFDFKKYKKSADKDDVPFTPAITLMVGLKKVLAQLRAKGCDKALKDYAKLTKQLKDSLSSMGVCLFSKSPSSAVTAISIPEGVDGVELVKSLKKKGIHVAGGQAQLKGKIIRVAHMGGITSKDIEETIKALKDCLGKK